jgi:YHS domain-containing protein
MTTTRLALALALALGAATPAFADNARLVLKGYDPVAYFTMGKPVKGDPKLAYDFDDGRYYFSSAKHREMFAGDPDKYAPQFGGYCTGSMSRGVRNEGDPEGWVIREGKLYVFGAARFKAVAEQDPNFIPSRLDSARKNWNEKKRGS